MSLSRSVSAARTALLVVGALVFVHACADSGPSGPEVVVAITPPAVTVTAGLTTTLVATVTAGRGTNAVTVTAGAAGTMQVRVMVISELGMPAVGSAAVTVTP